MTREEAIEVIEQDIPCEHDRDLIEALEMAISALKEPTWQEKLEKEYLFESIKEDMTKLQVENERLFKEVEALKGGWIPVTERLPENNDDVLVYDGSDIFVAWYGGIDGNWCSADNRFDEYTPIVAWQPLPEPYKKGE